MAKKTAKLSKTREREQMPKALAPMILARRRDKAKAEVGLKDGILAMMEVKMPFVSAWTTWINARMVYYQRNYGRDYTKEQAAQEFANALDTRARQVRGLAQRKGAYI